MAKLISVVQLALTTAALYRRLFVTATSLCHEAFTSCVNCQRRSTAIRLHGGKRNKKKSPARSKQKRGGGRSKSNNQLTSSVDNSNSNTEYNDLSSSSSLATQRKPSSLAGVTEDHRYEQFFYNEQTSNELYQLVELYNRPILLCNPTLAVLAEKKGPNIQIIRSRYTVQFFKWIRTIQFGGTTFNCQL